MRNLNLEELHVETVEMQPEYAEFDGAVVASVLWDTQTRPIQRPNTNDTRCIA